MDEDLPRPLEHRRHRQNLWAAWTGSIAGVLALVLAVLVWRPWSSASPTRPRLQVDVTTQAGAASFEKFIRAHDGEVVYLDVRCDSYGSDSAASMAGTGPKSHCYFQELDNYSDESPKAFWLSTFSQAETARHWWNSTGHTSEAGRGELWTYFPEKPIGSSAYFDENHGDGSSGAGGLEAKGYFGVVVTGSGSLGPAGLDNVDLRPQAAPSA